MKLRELFSKMATRAGIPATDAKFTTALELIPADADVDDDVVANPLTQNLITSAEAEANPKIKGKFTAEAYNGFDALIDPALSDFLEPAEIEALKGDKMTTKKLTKLLEKAKAAKAASGNSTETALAITKLNEEIAKLKSDGESVVNSLKSQHEEERYYDRLAMKVTARNDVTDYAKAKEGRRVITDFRDTLDGMGGVLDLSTGKVMQKADRTLPLFIDNKAVDVDAVLTKTLTDNDYIKKSEPAPSTVITVPGGKPDAANEITPAQQQNAERLKKSMATT